MFDSIFILLALLAVKHWYVDFVNQTPAEIANKGTYGHNDGIMHSVKHGVGTFLVMLMFIGDWPFAFTLASIDTALHYHIDWIKMRFGTKDMKTNAFWTQLGLDQLAHTLTYILLVWLVV
jgi:hypothetical protein